MPYSTIDGLPERVRRALPEHAQEIYLAAFNNAWGQYADRADRDQVAHRVAWTAVKKIYEKGPGGAWVRSR
ncbi:MAG TPA: ChaB family protein [bacterium]|nr:ChaB family protein [bacterium]